MHKILFAVLLLYNITAYTQSQTFDITTYTPPKTWKKQSTESSLQFSKEDEATGAYCIIMLMKAIPGTDNSKENFDAAWETLVKEMVTVSTAPEMQTPAKEDGWEAQSGYAPFESEGQKGIALLVTSSGYQKMVNIVILTNTDAYEKDMTAFLESVSFKKQVVAANKPVTKPTVNNAPVVASKNDGYTFNITNFDDGWTSTVQEDWVEVKKGNLKVLIHYPKDGTIFPADPDVLTSAAWNILVAPRYSNLENYKSSYISTYDRPYLGMGTATDNATGKKVFIFFLRQGSSGWIEFVSPDKNSFIQQFKFDPEVIRWDSETDLLKPAIAMVSYNKFAIGVNDFKGEWTNDFSGVQQLYNVYSGNYAGMKVFQSRINFIFSPGNNYKWDLMMANGMVGSMKYDQAKASGKFSIVNNWQIKFSDIEGKPKIYHAYFSCIKGARLLHLLDASYPGNGMYTTYGKK